MANARVRLRYLCMLYLSNLDNYLANAVYGKYSRAFARFMGHSTSGERS